ncbi:MAG TPA: PspC domain-containing protein [Euzebyales bacterium]|nr:PspC domain-containing protein [Euzebyales bacterium]
MSATTPSDAGDRTAGVPTNDPVGELGPPAEPTSTARPPLRRSTDDKVIAGVAGGLGRYLGVDPVVIRIALVVFALSGGAGVLLYLIGWIAIPEEAPGEVPAQAARPERSNGAVILGAVLVAAGGLLFTERLIPSFSAYIGPVVLIGLGAALVLGARR